jgi:uncharacterized tellurite resistance protein B-like protein
MCADKKVTESEREAVHRLINKTKAFYNANQIDARIDTFMKRVEEQGLETIVNSTCERIPLFTKIGKKELLLKCIRYMMYADGKINRQEVQLCKKFETSLESKPQEPAKEECSTDITNDTKPTSTNNGVESLPTELKQNGKALGNIKQSTNSTMSKPKERGRTTKALRITAYQYIPIAPLRYFYIPSLFGLFIILIPYTIYRLHVPTISAKCSPPVLIPGKTIKLKYNAGDSLHGSFAISDCTALLQLPTGIYDGESTIPIDVTHSHAHTQETTWPSEFHKRWDSMNVRLVLHLPDEDFLWGQKLALKVSAEIAYPGYALALDRPPTFTGVSIYNKKLNWEHGIQFLTQSEVLEYHKWVIVKYLSFGIGLSLLGLTVFLLLLPVLTRKPLTKWQVEQELKYREKRDKERKDFQQKWKEIRKSYIEQ